MSAETGSFSNGAYAEFNNITDELDGLQASKVKANVVLDLFLDSDPILSNSTMLPTFEIMIWLGSIAGLTPIGWGFHDRERTHTQKVDGTKL